MLKKKGQLLLTGLLLTVAFSFKTATPENTFYPKNYFRAPLNGVLRLTGTFGELRPDHFHSGVDISPNEGKSGQPIFAVADGYVERVKAEPRGYGRAVYIRHPNGYTSLYAHLEKFAPAMEDFIKAEQYRLQKFHVDFDLDKTKFPVKKGDVIGRLGTTGSSSGPHLHFEIRNASTGNPINPLLFGFAVQDNIPPKMHQLKVYHLNEKKETQRTQLFTLIKKGTQYGIKGDTLTIGAWRAGFALKVYDHINGSKGWAGIYQLQMFRNDSLVYDFTAEKFDFDETRYINAHLDYEEQVSKKSYFNRCYLLPGNKLSLIDRALSAAVTPLFKDRPQKIKLTAKDIFGNATTLQFWVKRGEVKAENPAPYNYLLPFDEPSTIASSNFEVHFPAGSFYQDCYLDYKNTVENSEGYYSAVHHLHNYKTPVHKSFDISIAPFSPLPADIKNKAIIVYCGRNGKMRNCGGTWKGEKLTTQSRVLGDYCIMVDKIPPTIQPVTFGPVMTGQKKMSFKILDNFDISGDAKKLRYRGTVDGQWILMESDEKYDLLLHYFDGRIPPGEHMLKIEVWDDRDNRTIFEQSFQL